MSEEDGSYSDIALGRDAVGTELGRQYSWEISSKRKFFLYPSI